MTSNSDDREQKEERITIILIEVNGIRKVYGAESAYKTLALDDVSFQVDKGEFVGIMGASGSGKSTLLNMLAAIDSPDAGQIIYEGEDITGFNEERLARYLPICRVQPCFC